MGKKKTHEEFLEDLKVKNPKAYEELEFLEEYKGNNKEKIKAKDKYGIVLVTPSDLLSGKSQTILVAEDKHMYFLNKLKDVNKKAYEELEFIGTYSNSRTKMKARDKYGEVLVIPNVLLLGGVGWSIKSAINQTEYFSKMLEMENNNIFMQIRIIGKYNGFKSKILVTDEYGELEIIPEELLSATKLSIKSAKNKTEYFKSKSRVVHSGFYDYGETIYEDWTTEMEIICPKHGIFKQNASVHMKGHGCKKCGDETSYNGFKKNDWINLSKTSKKFDSFKLYKLKMYSEEECFYKIGITFTSIATRMGKGVFGNHYKYEVLEIIESSNGEYIYDLEKRLHKKYGEYKYEPNVKFCGYTECFSYIGID